MLSRILLLPALASVVLASTHKIVWKASCPAEIASLNSTLPIVCGSLAVPLDYTNVSSGNLDLLLYKIAVGSGTKSKHTVLLNFGGPGNDGLAMLSMNATGLQILLGGDHDMILVNPRGTGANFNFSCSQNAAEGALQASWTRLSGNASDTAPGDIWATTALYGDACKHSPGATNGDLIGTGFTARDFMQVAQALDEDGLIYYQGFSYGTVLGMTIAALFPEKIGRMVLDGNVNPYQYYHNSYVDYYPDTDSVFSIFCSTCIATPQLCALARNQSALELENELLDFFEQLKYQPLPVPFPHGEGAVVDYSFVVNSVYAALYEPTFWPGLSLILAGLLTGDTSLIPESMLIPLAAADALSGIRCGDNRIRESSPSALDPAINATEAESPIFGGTSVPLYYTCAQWPFFAKGNFTWPASELSLRLKRPALLIGNSHDPVTPLANAVSNSAMLEGSVVLQHGGVGHTAFLTQGSLCTARALRAYWVNGTLPQPGTVCSIDGPVFATDNGWDKVLKELAREIVGGSA